MMPPFMKNNSYYLQKLDIFCFLLTQNNKCRISVKSRCHELIDENKNTVSFAAQNFSSARRIHKRKEKSNEQNFAPTPR